jgi:hypothetical protein
MPVPTSEEYWLDFFRITTIIAAMLKEVPNTCEEKFV